MTNMDIANKNAFATINGYLFVHLCGHVSQHFEIVKKRYGYWNTVKCSEEEFIEACQKQGVQCKIVDNHICVWNDTEKIEISADGNVSINGEPFTIEMQIENDRKENYNDTFQRGN